MAMRSAVKPAGLNGGVRPQNRRGGRYGPEEDRDADQQEKSATGGTGGSLAIHSRGRPSIEIEDPLTTRNCDCAHAENSLEKTLPIAGLPIVLNIQTLSWRN